MSREPAIAFVILTWNSEAYLNACLDSVLSLGYGRMAVLVFENGSADGTARMLDEYERLDERVISVRSDRNVGTTVSRNTLLGLVPDWIDYVCVLDSDTQVNRVAMDALVLALRRHPDVGVVGPQMANSQGKPQLSGRNLPTLAIKLGKVCPVPAIRRKAEAAEMPRVDSAEDIQDVGYLLSACWLVPREVFDTVGLFDERIFYAPEDVDWCVRAHRAGLRVCLCPSAHIVHEYQRISHKRVLSKANWEHAKGLAYYYAKHRYLFDSSKAC